MKPFANNQVNPKIFHRRIKVFFHRFGNPVDLIDEQNLVGLQIGQAGHEVLGSLQTGAR